MYVPLERHFITRASSAVLVLAVFSGLAQAQEEGEPGQPTTATAEHKKGLFIQSADGAHEMTIQGRVQPRFTYENSTDGLSDAPESGDMFFTVQRARIVMKGHTINKDISYKFQADFGQGEVSLKDFYLDYAISRGVFHLRAGQWKRPFSRQHITSSGKQEFVDRALTDEAFGAGRDVGLMLHNNYTKAQGIEWAAGIFNGNGANEVPDARFNPAVVARVGYNNGVKGYSEADLAGGSLRFGVGASGQVHLDGTAEADNGVKAEVDAIVKVQGLSATAAFYLASPLDETAAEAMGYHAQLGYVLGAGWQPAVRFASHMPDGDNNDTSELGVAISKYMNKHGLKWQTDITYEMSEGLDEAGEVTTDTGMALRSQLQLVF